MKKWMCAAALTLLLFSAALGEELPRQLTLAPGESREFSLPFPGYWDSDAPEVATAAGAAITAHEECWRSSARRAMNGRWRWK